MEEECCIHSLELKEEIVLPNDFSVRIAQDGKPKENAAEHADKTRVIWRNTTEYILNAIGYTVGMGNLWRFSYLCYKNGGGAFLIPYLTLAITCGLPALFLETSIGQFTQRGCIGSWDLVPLLKGAGYSALIISWYYLSYGVVIMAWALIYLAHSFTVNALPWSHCENSWNTNSCIVLSESNANASYLLNNYTGNQTDFPTAEFYKYYVLRQTESIYDMGSFTNWRLMIAFVVAWLITYLCVINGVKTSGKIAYVTVIFPYIILLVMLIRGATLEGAGSGVMHYITPKLEKLLNFQIWIDAGGQIIYTLGLCTAGLYGLGSYNSFHTNCYRNAMFCVGVCCCTSVLIGFVLYCYLGHMATQQNRDIDEIAGQGPGLVFEVFPAGLNLLPAAPVWSIIFFLMIIMMSIDSVFGTVEGITKLLEDIRPQLIKKFGMQMCRFGMCVVPILLGIPMLCDGGIYVFELINMYGNSGICLLLVAITEVGGICWIYGIDKYFDNIKEMIGYYPNKFFKYCLQYVGLLVTLIIFCALCFQYEPLKLDDYEYPTWANVVGWMLTLSVLTPIPVIAVKAIASSKGSFRERWRQATEDRFVRGEFSDK